VGAHLKGRRGADACAPRQVSQIHFARGGEGARRVHLVRARARVRARVRLRVGVGVGVRVRPRLRLRLRPKRVRGRGIGFRVRLRDRVCVHRQREWRAPQR